MYYTIGFFIVSLIYDIALLFSVTSVAPTIEVLLAIYTWSFILIGLVFLGYVQEWFKDLIKNVEDMKWGVQ